jgi:sugar diacid utilization regulator/GAF domain-containing protein
MKNMNETLSHLQLQSLIQVSNVLNSSLDINTIIDSIMNQTISVIAAADGGVLFLFDPEQQRLIPHSSQGFKDKVLSKVRLKPGESMTGLAFSARQCLIFPNQEEVKKAVATMSDENLPLLETSIPNYPYSTICAPILSKGDCIGVITLDSFSPSLPFKNEDITLLGAISHQSAVALEKANLYREKEKTVRELEKLNHTITQQNKLLSRSFEIHSSLADLVLNGHGLHAILEYIHQKVGLHTFLFDDLGELIGTTDQASLSLEQMEVIRQKALPLIDSLEMAHTLSDVEIAGQSQQLVVLPIGSRPKLLGILTLLVSKEIGEVDIAALEHACTVISLELVKERAVFETQQRLRGELIDQLFSERIDDTIIQKAKHLNFDPKRNYMAVVAHLDDIRYEKEYQREGMMWHIHQMVNGLFRKNNLQGMAVRKHDQMIILLSFPGKISASFATQQVKEFVTQFQQEIQMKNWQMTVSIGIGRIQSGLISAHKSLHEAIKCIQFMNSYSQKNKIISYSDLGVQRLLLQNTEEELIDFITEELGPLIEYEKSRKGELLATLFVYVESNLNVKDASDSLHIHTNTLIYRLKRIEEILCTDLSDSRQFLNIHLAIRMYQFLKEKIKAFSE